MLRPIRPVLLALAFLASATAFAEQPKAVITDKDGGIPPSKLIPGQINLLDSSQSVGDKFSWKVRISLAASQDGMKAAKEHARQLLEGDGWKLTPPADSSGDLWSLVEGRRKLLMPSLPGTYHVILVAAGEGDPDIAEYDLTIDGGVTPGPGPGPVPPGPSPDPQPIGLSAAVAAEVAKVVKPETHAEWLRLAEALQKVATLADAGTLATVEQFVGTSKIFEDVSLSTSASAAAAWATIKQTTIAPRLKLTTVAEYSKSWKEIAAGVKTGAGAQPPPGPTPPTPTPLPVTDRMRVLIRYDTLAAIPASQESIITGNEIRAWLDANVGRENYRIWDRSVTGEKERDQFWREAGKLEYGSLPWIFISNGRPPGFSNALPKDIPSTLSVLKEFKP